VSKRIAVIPDVQIRSGDDLEFLSHIGQYLVKIKPDIIVQIGDFADLPSLSTHDKPGARGMEGKRYKADIIATHAAMEVLMAPIWTEQRRLVKNKKELWNPKKILTLGNHEHRISRAIENDPIALEGIISLEDLNYEKYGWEVHPFLKPVVVEGIAFCHYFVSGVMGRPVGTAQMLINKHHMSCFAGHQQGRMIAYGRRADGQEITSIIAGSCYEHSEDYLNPQTNEHWRGLFILNDVVDGSYDEMPVSLRYLRKRYG
jgi:hypothetical protein